MYALRSQWNMRAHVAIAVLVLLAAYRLHVARGSLIALVFVIALVLVLELLNTAVEAVVDLTTSAEHPLAKAAKDCAAGAVLVGALAAVVVGALIFLAP